jgi:Cleft lip and palate transmembrane protein 1 (CLPTM1)
VRAKCKHCDLSVHDDCPVLTRYLPKPKIRKERSLLQNNIDGLDGQGEPEVWSRTFTLTSLLPYGQVPDNIVSFWHQVCVAVFTALNVVDIFFIRTLLWHLSRMLQSYNMHNPPLQLRSVRLQGIILIRVELDVQADIHLVPGQRDETGTKGYYHPIIFPNEFWHLRSQYIEINATTPTVPLKVVFQPMSYFKFQAFASMTFGFQEATKQQGGGSAAEIDEVKRMLVETNPWFLALTGVVSVLHVVSVSQVFLLLFLTWS